MNGSEVDTNDCQLLAASIGEAFVQSVQFMLDDPRVDSAATRVEALRAVCRIVAGGEIHQVENHDPAYPQLARVWTPLVPYACPNPDFSYLAAPIHGDYSYRVFGTRGTSQFLGLGVIAGDHHRVNDMHTLDTKIHVRDGRGNFDVANDGAVEFVLSRDKQDGNWMPLPDRHGFLVVRYAYYDWETEIPPEIFIERVGATYPPPVSEPADILDKIGMLRDFLVSTPPVYAKMIERYFEADDSTIPFPPLDNGSGRSHANQLGFDHQFYGQGHYRMNPGEAVVLEVTPPDCWYWGFHLASQYRESTDLYLRTMSINGHQAWLGADGVFRSVISPVDPGVPNWFDTGGRTVGLVVGRYIGAEAAPVPQLRVIPFEQVREHMPADTPVVSPSERSDSIRRRMHAVHRRHDI